MRKAQELHNLAMQDADKALAARRSDDEQLASGLFASASKLEASAAALTREQPSRAILFRSASNLAIECKDLHSAEQLACLGLIGRPPADIAQELRHALDRATFERHLRLAGITLSSSSVQISVAGPSIGVGDAPEPEIMGRVEAYRKLVARTANRRRGVAYTDTPAHSATNADYQLFMSTPRAASFAVTLRVGSREMQHHFEFDVSPDTVAADVFNNLGQFESKGEAGLRESISNPDYRRNFVALARRLAPDGNRITTVGLTRGSPSGEEVVAMRRPRSAHPVQRDLSSTTPTKILEGRLEAADRRGKSKSGRMVLSAAAEEYKIAVPKGVLADIVRPHFGELVTLRARKRSLNVYEFVEFVE